MNDNDVKVFDALLKFAEDLMTDHAESEHGGEYDPDCEVCFSDNKLVEAGHRAIESVRSCEECDALAKGIPGDSDVAGAARYALHVLADHSDPGQPPDSRRVRVIKALRSSLEVYDAWAGENVTDAPEVKS